MVEDEVEVNDKFVIKSNNDQVLVQRGPCNQVRVSLPVNEEDAVAPFISKINKDIVLVEQAPCFYLEQYKIDLPDDRVQQIATKERYPFVSEEDALEEVNNLQFAFATAEVDTDTDGN